ncbi:NDP-hexose 2,3-dehydratase family protein [Geobacter chapellei]|uniref:NDP-hexose 2,3-dehydratase family protein n=2 Tax=Pelotalea chapellei TaxID=44671 RepID=A0ABS5UAJ9_9BACT|nr:NDP-hexose 2,3-dehydratase family protein [Pelotalea chapellei]
MDRAGVDEVPDGDIPADAAAGIDLVLSRTLQRALHDDLWVDEWIRQQRAQPCMQASIVPLGDMGAWGVDPVTGNIAHSSGGFFTVTGITVRHRGPCGEITWDQPAIDQPEVGILGILAAPINGVLHFCLQAKEEPGNIGPLQLSPTVQATYSNYTRAHGGAATPLVEYFMDPPREQVMFAKLQTEDGGRFLFKSNRNMIVRLNEAPPLPGNNFIWLTLRQISQLMTRDNLLHACTRSVLSSLVCGACSNFRIEDVSSEIGEMIDLPHTLLQKAKYSAARLTQIHDAVQWLDDQRAANHVFLKREPMNSLSEWTMGRDGIIRHRENRFFNIVGLSVQCTGREVVAWNQPILAPIGTGVIGLLMKLRNERRYFLMQAKVDAGNRTSVQIGPTVQFTPMNYLGNQKLSRPFLFDEFTGKGRFKVLRESWQAEEGARFYREQHRHCILQLPEDEQLEVPPDFRWFSEEELGFFLNLGDSVNSCARSILACLI